MAKNFLPEATAADQAKLDKRKEKQASISAASASSSLTADQNKQIADLQKAWSDASALGDTALMNDAHQKAEQIRATAGFSGGADGSQHIALSGTGGAPVSSGVSGPGQSADALLADAQPQKQEPAQPALSTAQNEQITALQDAWAKANAAGDQAGMDAAHTEAEKIRASAGYLGGADGSAVVPIITRGNAEDDGRPTQQKSAIDGGYTADDVAQWVGSYDAATSNPYTYTNGFDANMNNRSKANMIRQQMYANSQAWANADPAQREYLHAQNVALAAELERATGGVKSTYNAALGRWETDNGDLGYGVNTYWENYLKNGGNADGLTQEMIDKFANDTDRYSNYVSQNARNRWFTDESGGYTGQYAHFMNGPNWRLMSQGNLGLVNPREYQDLVDDGFNDAAYWHDKAPRDANGNLVQQAPVVKPNNTLDYTKSKSAHVDQYGIIQPGVLNGTTSDTAHYNMWLNGGTPVADTGENYGVTWGSTGRGFANAMGMGDAAHRQGAQARLEAALAEQNGASSYEQQINAMYDADLDNQLSALEQQYMQALSDLDKTAGQVDSQYSESRRQMTGDAERQAAAQREIFNARGVNSGTIGQSQLATSGELQNQINAMNNAQASAEAQLQMQRALLAQTYQLQIQQAEAENDYARAQALLQEAQRVDEVLRQQEQQNAQNALAYMQLMMGG